MNAYAWMSNIPLQTTDGVLVVVCFVLSVFNTSVGPSGGMMFAVMATLLPPAAVVPVHAAIQGGGTFVRLLLLRRHINVAILRDFVIGGVAGFILGGWLYTVWQPPDDVLQLLLGVFILSNLLKQSSLSQSPLVVKLKTVGAFVSFLTIFVGATSSLSAVWLAKLKLQHTAFLATFTACMFFQNIVKVCFFGALGFSFGAYGPLLVVLLLATAAGSWAGKYLLRDANGQFLTKLCLLVAGCLGVNLIVRNMFWSNVEIGSPNGAIMILLIVTLAGLAGFRGKEIMRSLEGSEGVILVQRYFSVAMSYLRSPVLRAVVMLITVSLIASQIPHRTRFTQTIASDTVALASHSTVILPVLSISELLKLADADFKAYRLTTPKGNNAWERYTEVLRRDAGNSDARKGLQRIVAQYVSLARGAEAENRPKTAQIYLSRARSVVFGL